MHCASCSFISNYFLISLWRLLWPTGYLGLCCKVSTCIWISPTSFRYWFLWVSTRSAQGWGLADPWTMEVWTARVSFQADIFQQSILQSYPVHCWWTPQMERNRAEAQLYVIPGLIIQGSTATVSLILDCHLWPAGLDKPCKGLTWWIQPHHPQAWGLFP